MVPSDSASKIDKLWVCYLFVVDVMAACYRASSCGILCWAERRSELVVSGEWKCKERKRSIGIENKVAGKCHRIRHQYKPVIP